MFGSHLSIAGGVHKALLEAERLNFDTVQVFTANPRTFHNVSVQRVTKNQQQWRVPPLSDDAVAAWKRESARLKFEQTVSHDSYLINLASPDAAMWKKSLDLFVEELRRCVALGIPYLVTHPGAHVGCGEEAGLKRVAEALDIVHSIVPIEKSGKRGPRAGRLNVVTCLEITAGQGSCLGHRLEHLATIIDKVKAPERLAVCLDTAHLFAAGYDFRGRKYAAFVREIERTVGIERIKVWHLNDSKRELGSRVDRHDHIGKGHIGLEGFKPIVRDKRWRETPKILETPKEKSPDGRDWDAVNLETLRGLE